MSQNVAEFVWKRLSERGCRVYVYPGDSVGGLDGALGRQDVKKAAEILNKGEKIAMLVAALHATDEVIAVANRLNAGVAKALL
jgi:hypothetical protein